MHRFGRCPVLGPKPRNGTRAALTSHLVNRRNVVQRGRRRVNITSWRVQVFDWNFFFIETLTAPAALSVHVCTLNTIFLPALQPRTVQRGCLFIVAKSKLGRHRGHYKFLAFQDGLSKYSKRGLPLRASGSGLRDYKSRLKGRGMKNEVGKLTPSDYFLSVRATHTRDQPYSIKE